MRWYLLFLPLFFVACNGGSSVPKGVLPPAKMEVVLYDFIRADEMVDYLRLTDSAYRPFAKRTALYDSIFQLHAVTKQTFQKSLKFYQGRPDLFKGILDDLQKKAINDTSKRHIAVKAL